MPTPLCTVNGLGVAEASINLPRIGVWHADLSVDSFDSPTGKAVIQYGSQTFNGVFGRGGPNINAKLRARVLGGKGSLSLPLPPRGYRTIPLRIPLVDILNGAGEVLSPTSDAGLLAFTLNGWFRLQMTAGQAIELLLQEIAHPGVQSSATVSVPSWRVLRDGTIWVGYESWVTSSLKDTMPLYAEPEQGNITIYSNDPVILPGTTFQYPVIGKGTISRKISYVRHVIRARFRHTTLYYED